ncbi:MAG: TerB family tellurite resistance protein [Polyangiaceae bacterium]|nr:TerB family tellurite resistance protein [Polyangiaceae bacterium]
MNIETATIRRLRDALLQSGRRPSAVLSSAYETLTRSGMLSPEEAGALERVDPLAETMFLMMSADGRVSDEEKDAVRGAVRGLTDGLLHSGTINVMLENYEKRLAEQGRDERLREIADTIAEEPTEAEGAFALAAAIALADDDVADEENELISQLAEWFGITEERADQILDQLEDDRDEGEGDADEDVG